MSELTIESPRFNLLYAIAAEEETSISTMAPLAIIELVIDCAGRETVPVAVRLLIVAVLIVAVLITGAVRVLFVSVCVPSTVTNPFVGIAMFNALMM